MEVVIGGTVVVIATVVTIARASQALWQRRRQPAWLSRYELKEPWHGSNFGQAFYARDLFENRDVLLRVFPRRAPDRRFLRELHAARRLNSPYTIRVLDCGPGDAQSFCVAMEPFSGTSLGDMIKKNGALPETVAAQFVAQICVAVEEAHDAGILHLGLQPGNVFLSDVAGQPAVKVMDFGVARASLLTDHLGTVAFMAPEVWEAGPVDHRADVYSIGAIFYYLVTGRQPFVGNNAGELYWAHVHEVATPPSERCQVSAPLSNLIMWCLAKRPEERPQNTRAIVEALAAYLPRRVAFIRRRGRFARGSRPPLQR